MVHQDTSALAKALQGVQVAVEAAETREQEARTIANSWQERYEKERLRADQLAGRLAALEAASRAQTPLTVCVEAGEEPLCKPDAPATDRVRLRSASIRIPDVKDDVEPETEDLDPEAMGMRRVVSWPLLPISFASPENTTAQHPVPDADAYDQSLFWKDIQSRVDQAGVGAAAAAAVAAAGAKAWLGAAAVGGSSNNLAGLNTEKSDKAGFRLVCHSPIVPSGVSWEAEAGHGPDSNGITQDMAAEGGGLSSSLPEHSELLSKHNRNASAPSLQHARSAARALNQGRGEEAAGPSGVGGEGGAGPGSPGRRSQVRQKPGAIELLWTEEGPRTALVVAKLSGGAQVAQAVHQVSRILVRERRMAVYCEPSLKRELGEAAAALLTWPEQGDPPTRPPPHLIRKLDLVVTLGGDGTVLWVSSLLGDGPMPPLVSFALGSLGFMTPFAASSPALRGTLEGVLRGGFHLTLRHRLHCRVQRAQGPPGGGEDKVVLNELVLDRGVSPFLTHLECYCNDTFVTTVQGDGLIVSTPSGSTAYSLAAGGSMVHPQVPCILFTPICPHSLSFRPLVFPDGIRLRLQIPEATRATMWASFDGKDRIQLSGGDAVVIMVSQWPIPTVCYQDATSDWFRSVTEGLNWNQRTVQGAGENARNAFQKQ